MSKNLPLFSHVVLTVIKWMLRVITSPLTFPAMVMSAMEKTQGNRLKIGMILGLASVFVYLLALFELVYYWPNPPELWNTFLVFVTLQALGVICVPESIMFLDKILTHRKDEIE